MMKRGHWSVALASTFVFAVVGIGSYGLLRSAAGQDAKPGQDAPSPPGRDDARPRGDGPPGRRPDGPPNVERSMKGMNRALQTLHEQIKDAAKLQENLQLVSDAQRNCIAAKGAPVPEDVLKSAKDEAARKQMSTRYRRDLIAVLKKLVEVEENLLDGKNDAAAAALDAVVKLRDDAHEAMGVKDED
ncbi:MAG: hypothetical protein JNG88_01270 [Phycisphaerales bacterium]|nr:hypothetical protein [Phycisphaerales bacterium]